MLVPEPHQRTRLRDRQRLRERIGRAAQHERVRLGLGGAGGGGFLTQNRTTLLLIAVGVLVLLGGALVSRSRVATISNDGIPRVGRRQAMAIRELTALRYGLEGFRRDCGGYPSASNGLKALVLKLDNPKWDGPYVNMVRSDPWHRPYLYRDLDGSFVLKSVGPDGVENTPDDCFPLPDTNAPLAAGATVAPAP
jgi:type II secretion system protein G